MTKEYSLLKENMNVEYVKSLSLTQLPQFCDEVRKELIQIVSKTGGHIGVNLGVIELTVALYRTFDFPKDSLIWDIGHQIYVQKMITGRLDKLKTNRQNGGSPGYSFSNESIFDRVTSSHGGASISFALGVAITNRLRNNNSVSVAVVGDGAFVEGSIQEAINHMAVDNSKMIVILNDNERAIEDNFGGLHEYFKKRKIGTNEKETHFSSLGIPYYGPLDGHDVINLVENLTKLKQNLQKPTVVHVKTIKGKGLEKMAKNSPVKIHWNFRFDPSTGENTEAPRAKGYAAFAGEAIDEILTKFHDSVLITPAVQSSTGISNIFPKHKDRCFDVSLAEQHSITLGGGFALEGMRPIIAMESTFMQRGFDQLLHDICLNKLPVLVIAARSGHTGLDHITHNALHDLIYLRCLPNLRILYPATHTDLKNTIISEFENLKQPTVILYPKADILDDPDENFLTDKDNIKRSDRATGLILSVGPQNKNGIELKHILYSDNKIFDHIAVTQISPLSTNVTNLISEYNYIITLEEGILDGGFSNSILEYINDNRINSSVIRIGFSKQFVEHGTRDYIYKKFELDAHSIYNKIKETWPEIWVTK